MKPDQLQNISEAFRQSLEDHLMTKKERRALDERLDITIPVEQERNVLRSEIFAMAKDMLTDENSEQILQWLEESMKLLLRDREAGTSQNRAYFSPGFQCRDAIIELIRNAKKSLRICVFTISDDDITHELIKAKKRGVSMQIISDDEKQFDLGSDLEQLRKAGIKVEVDKSTAHMHHKFMIVDTKYLLTGSYNWTRSAAKYNQENILITEDNATILRFADEFSRLWKQFK